jgi:hypothetical protein
MYVASPLPWPHARQAPAKNDADTAGDRGDEYHNFLDIFRIFVIGKLTFLRGAWMMYSIVLSKKCANGWSIYVKQFFPGESEKTADTGPVIKRPPEKHRLFFFWNMLNSSNFCCGSFALRDA